MTYKKCPNCKIQLQERYEGDQYGEIQYIQYCESCGYDDIVSMDHEFDYLVCEENKDNDYFNY